MFDNNIEIDLIKKVINYNPKWLMYTPDRLDIEKTLYKSNGKRFLYCKIYVIASENV